MVVTNHRPVQASSGGNIEAVFETFSQAQDSVDILLSFQKLKEAVGAHKLETGKQVYACLKSKLQSWKCKSLWEVLDARAKHKEYGNGKICEDIQVLVIGAGPIGLRTAIEVALLGAKVIVVEKRTTFGRNNVLHLWPFLIQDFRSLGAKRFYGKFCAGSLDHISIRILQCMLMKAALILGVQIYAGVTFEKIIEPSGDAGWRCTLDPPFHPASQVDYDMVIGADGKKNVLPDFPQIEMRGSLAIGITLNLVYRGTKQEAAIPEISGLAYHFKPQFFDELYQESGVRLENFVYYKNETHYFVMTAVKGSLLAKGVLLMDYPKPDDLLAPKNVNTEKLKEYALAAVKYGTGGQLTNLEFVLNDRGKPDIAVFDFTSLKKAEHAARILERKGHRLLMALVGDSLIEPFWPTGSGCARGVLSALDTAWMLRSFAMDKPPLQVLSERESVYKLLSATSVNNLRKKYDEYTINPFTRYVDVNVKRVKEVYHLYDSDDPVNADFRVSSPTAVGTLLENTKRRMSISHQKGKSRRKSSSDDLDEKKEKKTRASVNKGKGIVGRRKSSSDDLDEKKDGKRKKSKKALRRSSEDLLAENSGAKRKISLSGKSLKNQQSRQSSESADENVQTKSQKKLGRGKSRESEKESNNNLGTIIETPKKTEGSENKENSTVMKQRSTKRWRLFGGTKPKLKSVDNDENSEMKNVSSAKKSKENDPGIKNEIARNGELGNKLTKGEKKKVQVNTKTKQGSIRETFGIPNPNLPRKEYDYSPKPMRTSIRKPSDIKKDETHFLHGGYSRNVSHIPFRTPEKTTAPLKRANSEIKRANDDVKRPNGEVKRPNSEIKRRGSRFGSLRGPKQEKVAEEILASEVSPVVKKTKAGGELSRPDSRKKLMERKSSGSLSVFSDIESLSPAAQRTAPVLQTLTPEKTDRKYSEGGAVTAGAGIAALVALTTPLAIQEQQPLKEFQMKRQKILSGQISAMEDKPQSTSGFRRDLSSALDSVDGSPKPAKRFFSFSSAKRNVKQKLEEENEDASKSLTLPKTKFGRHSLKSGIGHSLKDTPSALDSAMDILIKQYKFNELDNTLKLMLNIFRSISKDPEAEVPRRVCMDGVSFSSLVWNMKEARLFMVVSGWMEVGSFILFPKSKTVHEPIRVLMQNYRMLLEKQTLDISCPQFSPTDIGTKHRRTSDDTFRPQDVRRMSSGIQSLYREPDGDPARDDGKDTGSHSSDSGMGFSETASEKNIAAIILAKTSDNHEGDVTKNDCRDDVIASDVRPRGTGDKRSKQRLPMDPSMYLEDSCEVQKPTVDPSCYTKGKSDESLVVEQGENESRRLSTKKHTWEVLQQSPSTLGYPEGIHYSPMTQEDPTEKHEATNNNDFRNSTFQESKEHRWEILEQYIPEQHSPDGISYHPISHNDQQMDTTETSFRNPSFQEPKGHRWEILEESVPTYPEDPYSSITQNEQQSAANQSEFRDASFQEAVGLSNTLEAILGSLEEPMEYFDQHSELTTKDPYPEVFTEGPSKQGRKTNSKNELDDLFDTLDFVTEELQSPRIVCSEKKTTETKKSRRHPKSTETSRRREQFARSKMLANSCEEQPSPKPKRKTRNAEGARTRQATYTVQQDSKPVTLVQRREMPKRAAKTGKTASKKQESIKNNQRKDVSRDEVSAVLSNTGSSGSDESVILLRRSRRIAESSGNGRKAVLTLESSCSIEESSTDLNQGFVNTGLEDSQGNTTQENGDESRDSTNPKRRVRRKSSIVKSNKSRSRVKRNGYRLRKDRSMDA